MKYSLYILLLLQGIALNKTVAQTFDSLKTVLVSIETDKTEPAIIINWVPRSDALEYYVYKKNINDINWGSPLAILDDTVSTWTDKNIEIGKVYHYQVVRRYSGGNARGYIYSGVEVKEKANPGGVLLVIDTSILQLNINNELDRFYSDLWNEGWVVSSINVHRDMTAFDVKLMIQEAVDLATVDIKSLILLGRVPVPYSGFIYPDGHGPGQGNHQGAWPADGYYADLNGNWTDISINDTTANDPRNRNVPGDGKFDQGILPSNVELEIGRIDFSNLPAFQKSELDLLKQYFDKNHAFRTGQIKRNYRGLIENNFPGFTEGFGQNGLKNFSPMFGPGNIHYTDYDNLKSENYIWSYGCGAGSFTSCSGIGNTNTFVNDSIQSVFTMHFGSYFGDWDSPSNNYLKAALGSGTILSNAWAARPNYAFYPMGLGYTLGYCMKLSQNNPGNQHESGFANKGVHMALLGDPTLKMYIVESPVGFQLEETENGILASWVETGTANMGYDLLYRDPDLDTLIKINANRIMGNSHVIECPPISPNLTIFIRGVEEIVTASGSFMELSRMDQATIEIQMDYEPKSEFEFTFSGEIDVISFNNLSINADSFYWDFGNGQYSTQINPTHDYGSEGSFPVTLYSFNSCGMDSFSLTVEILYPSVTSLFETGLIEIYPNPTKGIINFKSDNSIQLIQVFDFTGVEVLSKEGEYLKNIDVTKLEQGTYLFKILSEAKWYSATIILIE